MKTQKDSKTTDLNTLKNILGVPHDQSLNTLINDKDERRVRLKILRQSLSKRFYSLIDEQNEQEDPFSKKCQEMSLEIQKISKTLSDLEKFDALLTGELTFSKNTATGYAENSNKKIKKEEELDLKIFNF